MVAYHARQRVLCPIFPDLRPACVRLGDRLTPLFVQLDQEISAFAADWTAAQALEGMAYRNGAVAGFHDGLTKIEEHAVLLQKETQIQLSRCDAEIRTLVGNAPATL